MQVQRLGASRKDADTLADWLDLLRGAHERRPFDLLHAYYITAPGFVAVYAGHLLGLPSVVSTRGNDLDRAVLDGSKAGQILYTLAHAGAITANSQDLARKAAALAPGRQATLIPNGVDTALFAPAPPDQALRASLGLDARPVVGFAGEARAKKGLGVLLVACRELARRAGSGHAGGRGTFRRRHRSGERLPKTKPAAPGHSRTVPACGRSASLL